MVDISRSPADRSERGVALVLVLLIVVLLYIIVAELVTRSTFDQMTAENQAAESGIQQALRLGFSAAIDELAEDSGGEEGGGEGGMSGAGGLGGLAGAGGSGAGAGAGAGGGEGEQDTGDSSRDSWFRPKSVYDDNKITVYAWFEDENRKFNVLSLVSPDEDFRELSRQRLVRLLDRIWEDSELDLPKGDAEIWVKSITEWMQGRERGDDRPKTPLKTNVEDAEEEIILPLSLDELRLVRQIPEDAWDDRIEQERFLPGLDAVLTVVTSLATDPGRPENDAPASGGAGGGDGGAKGGTKPPSPEQGAGGGGAGGGENENGQQVLGPGIRINVNTAPRVVLECLEDESAIPLNVIERLLRYRNEIDEEAQEAAEGEASSRSEEELLAEDSETKFKYFKTVSDLSQVKEYDQLPASDGKERFEQMLTTESNVFTIHLAAVRKLDESGRAFTVTKARAIVVRLAGGESGMEVQTLVPLHRVDRLRVFLPDFPEEEQEEIRDRESEDQSEFALEERSWNPFFPEFYDPEKRDSWRR